MSKYGENLGFLCKIRSFTVSACGGFLLEERIGCFGGTRDATLSCGRCELSPEL